MHELERNGRPLSEEANMMRKRLPIADIDMQRRQGRLERAYFVAFAALVVGCLISGAILFVGLIQWVA